MGHYILIVNFDHASNTFAYLDPAIDSDLSNSISSMLYCTN